MGYMPYYLDRHTGVWKHVPPVWRGKAKAGNRRRRSRWSYNR